MRLSRGISSASVVFGFIILVLAVGCIAAGAVTMSKFNTALSTIGVWAIYFLIPGILLVVAGFGRYIAVLGVGIGANVFGILVAIAGMIYAAGVWVVLNQTCLTISNQCICLGDIYDNAGSYTFDLTCSELTTIRYLFAAVTILYVVLLIISFVASIIGCAGACCAREEHPHRNGMSSRAYVVPYGNPNTMMMTRVEERRVIDHNPYARQQRYGIEGPYMEDKPRYYREPDVERRPYVTQQDYMNEGPYGQRMRYNNDRGYIHEPPTYQEPRALPAPHDYVFAAHGYS